MDTNQALNQARDAMRAYDRQPHDAFARHRAAQNLRDAFAALDHLLAQGAPAPASWAALDAELAGRAWRVVFRNSAGHTVATGNITALDLPWVRDRVSADLEIYFSWLVKDAVIDATGDNAAVPVIVPNPAHARTLAGLARAERDRAGEGDG